MLLGLTSCAKRSKRENHKQLTPAALNKGRSSVFISRRGNYTNLVQLLYEELVENDTALQRLEADLDQLGKSRSDSSDQVSGFKEKIEDYYHDAGQGVKKIEDSVLRQRMEILLNRNMERYNTRMGKNNELLKVIRNKHTSLQDMHVALKITRTLPLIEQYQKQYLPATKPLEGYIKQQDKTIGLLDTLLEK